MQGAFSFFIQIVDSTSGVCPTLGLVSGATASQPLFLRSSLLLVTKNTQIWYLNIDFHFVSPARQLLFLLAQISYDTRSASPEPAGLHRDVLPNNSGLYRDRQEPTFFPKVFISCQQHRECRANAPRDVASGRLWLSDETSANPISCGILETKPECVIFIFIIQR